MSRNDERKDIMPKSASRMHTLSRTPTELMSHSEATLQAQSIKHDFHVQQHSNTSITISILENSNAKEELFEGRWIELNNKDKTLKGNAYIENGDEKKYPASSIILRKRQATNQHIMEIRALNAAQLFEVDDALTDRNQKWVARILSGPSAFLAADEPMLPISAAGGILNLPQQFFCGYQSFTTNEALNRQYSWQNFTILLAEVKKSFKQQDRWGKAKMGLALAWGAIAALWCACANGELSAEDYFSINVVLASIIAGAGFITAGIQRSIGGLKLLKTKFPLSDNKVEEAKDSKFSPSDDKAEEAKYPIAPWQEKFIKLQGFLFWLTDPFVLALYTNKGLNFVNNIMNFLGNFTGLFAKDLLCTADAGCADIHPGIFWAAAAFLVINNIFFHNTKDNLRAIHEVMHRLYTIGRLENRSRHTKHPYIAPLWDALKAIYFVLSKAATTNGLTKSIYKFTHSGDLLRSMLFHNMASAIADDSTANSILSSVGAVLFVNYFFVVNSGSFCRDYILELKQKMNELRVGVPSPAVVLNNNFTSEDEDDSEENAGPRRSICNSITSIFCCKKLPAERQPLRRDEDHDSAAQQDARSCSIL